ncbi:hypothetical protein LEP3755_18790 [Leptolyngbya sp. NIES-3755]|nr:hypothetical protein LEP3755_18790 [Leptolyngbya sp. NIES-3755]
MICCMNIRYTDSWIKTMNELLDRSTRRWAMSCHLAGLLSIVVCSVAPIPFLGALFPYTVWRMGRDRHPFIDEQGRSAINFQLSMSVYLLVGTIFWIFLTFTTCMASFAGVNTNANFFGTVFEWLFLLGMVASVLFAVFMISVIIFAAVKASRGQSYRYPFSMRFLQ